MFNEVGKSMELSLNMGYEFKFINHKFKGYIPLFSREKVSNWRSVTLAMSFLVPIHSFQVSKLSNSSNKLSTIKLRMATSNSYLNTHPNISNIVFFSHTYKQIN
mgnify:CR=1 FL=1